MSAPVILFLHPSPEIRARAAAAFAGLPVQLRLAADAPSAPDALRGDRAALVIADVGSARAASALAEGQATEQHEHPALVLLASFEAEPLAFQSRAVALLHPMPSPSEAAMIAALAADSAGTPRLAAAVRLGQGLASSDDALVAFRRLGMDASPSVASWALYHAAAMLLQLGQLQDALEDLSALADEHPEFWRAHERLAAVWNLAGDPASAAHHHARALALQQVLAADSDAALAEQASAWDAARAAAPLPATPPPPTGTASGARDVIVADDSDLVREMLAEVLEAAGYGVRRAGSGTEAVELARQRRPDLLILDGLMPGKTGFDACKEIKESLYPSNPPKVLIFSAIYTKQRQRTEALALYGVDEVLAKPTDKALDPEELLAAVRRHLPG